MRLFLPCLIVLLAGCATGSRVEFDPVTAEHRVAVEDAMHIGALMLWKDVLAADASDYLVDNGFVDIDNTEVGGWITVINGLDPVVHFMAPSVAGPRIVHSVIYEDESYRHSDGFSASDRDRSMFRARSAAMNHLNIRCSNRYNTVVLDEGDHWLVYALAATTSEREMVVGGHNRFEIDKETGRILESRALSKSCLRLRLSEDRLPVVTHVVDPTPIAIHAYLSALHETTLYVVTRTGIWKADRGVIAKLESNEPPHNLARPD